MNITLVCSTKGCRLTFDGDMTLEHSAEMEDGIIDAMRAYKQLDVDLSGVTNIDYCGIHMLGLLQSMGGQAVNIVATSPVVEEALQRFLAPRRATSLPRIARGSGLAENSSRNAGHHGLRC